jgi:hypothetical protein
MRCYSRASLLARTPANPYLGHEPNARVATMPLYSRNVVSQGACPTASHSIVFIFGLVVESMKELAGAPPKTMEVKFTCLEILMIRMVINTMTNEIQCARFKKSFKMKRLVVF